MKKNTLHVACVILFCAASTAQADQTSTSSSGSLSNSSSTGIGQGGGSSLNNIGTSANSSVTGSSTSSSVGGIGLGGRSSATGGRSSASGGTSNVNVNVQLAQSNATGSGTGTTGTAAGTSGSSGGVAHAATDGPGTSAFDSRATVDQNVNQSSYSIRTTPSMGAPALTTTLSDTCMGSASFGLSITGFGATGGTTLVDQACVRRLDAREFRAMGLTDVALALLCQSDSNRRAVEATGHLCPGTTAPLEKTADAANPEAYASDEKYRDPLVRARLGLPITSANDPQLKINKQKELPKAEPIPAAKSIQQDVAEVETAPVPDAKIQVSVVSK